MKELDNTRIPAHVAIICDGNGRWAKKRGLPRTFGHRKGGFNIRDIARSCDKLGIKAVTFFCFSTENWNRPKAEVDALMEILSSALKHNIEKISKNNIEKYS